MNRIITMLLLLCTVAVANAQQGFGTNTPDPSAVMDMSDATKGVLLPRVALTGTGSSSPVTSPAANLLVFNTATISDVTPGFYFWNGTSWVRLLTPGDNTGTAWNLTGNAGTTPGTNFVGTTDAKDLAFKAGNTERMRVTSTGNVGIGTLTPNASALVEVSSITKGFIPPRMTEAQMAAIASPVEGLIIYNTTRQCLAYYAKGAFTCASVTPLTCGDNMTITHIAGAIAPVTKTVTYGTVLTSLTGSSKCWITQNLGADNQASSDADATEPSAGWYWQFNRAQGYKYDTSPTPTTWNSTGDSNGTDWISDNDPCTQLLGPGWRIPTFTEWTNADGAPQNWSSRTDTYNSVLKIHAAGGINSANGLLVNRGTSGGYWNSTQCNATNGYFLLLNNGSASISNNTKAYGFSVRCLRD